jgi:hypothetical protein
LAAGGVDLLVALVLALLLQSTTGAFFAERAATLLRVGEADTVWRGPIPLILGAISHLSYGYAFAWLVVLLPEAWSGTSPGKLLVRSMIAPETPSRRIGRFLIKTSGAWIFLSALLVGWWPLAILAVACGAAVAVGLLLIPFGSRRSLHDRLADTSVVAAFASHPGEVDPDPAR